MIPDENIFYFLYHRDYFCQQNLSLKKNLQKSFIFFIYRSFDFSGQNKLLQKLNFSHFFHRHNIFLLDQLVLFKQDRIYFLFLRLHFQDVH